MTVFSASISLQQTVEMQMLDITSKVAEIVESSGIENGIVTLFNIGSTGAITTIEFEPGLQQDLPQMLERIAPCDIPYQHDLTWHDGNGHSHCRASLLGPDITIPFNNCRLTLGTWQQILFIELDNKPHRREIAVQILGE
jgi:secondary thiamine-phosphate synthase enzyme